MKALVVYESFFGNTEQVARAVSDALASLEEVEVRQASEVTPEQLAGVDILVVGSPTRAFSPTPGIKKFLSSIPQGGLEGVRVAAFDTRIALSDIDVPVLPLLVKVFGYAAKPINDRLVQKGGEQAALPEGFAVEGTEGPLKEGEVEGAVEWARGIVSDQGAS
ncbi:MAG: flavodoxin domain-containing protein [Anaerolineae bacterium]